MKQLPQSMLRSYQKELKGLDKKDKTAHITMLEDLTDSFLTSQCDTVNEPEFLKKYAHPHSLPETENSQLMTHDIIGKPLKAFYR